MHHVSYLNSNFNIILAITWQMSLRLFDTNFLKDCFVESPQYEIIFKKEILLVIKSKYSNSGKILNTCIHSMGKHEEP